MQTKNIRDDFNKFIIIYFKFNYFYQIFNINLMFHSDISFTAKEKAVQFAEDAKNFMISFKKFHLVFKFIRQDVPDKR